MATRRSPNPKKSTASSGTVLIQKLFTLLKSLQGMGEPAAKVTAADMLSSMGTGDRCTLQTFLATSDMPTCLALANLMITAYHQNHKVALPRLTFLPAEASPTICTITNGPNDRLNIHYILNDVDSVPLIDYSVFWSNFSVLNRLPVPPSVYQSQYGPKLKAVINEIQKFREFATVNLQTTLNSYLTAVARSQRLDSAKGKSEDTFTFEFKQHIVQMINSSMQSLGLAIDYDGQPCYFSCTGGTSEGRFLLVPKGQKTALLARVNLADFLPLHLIDVSPPVGLPDWTDKEIARRTTRRSSDKSV